MELNRRAYAEESQQLLRKQQVKIIDTDDIRRHALQYRDNFRNAQCTVSMTAVAVYLRKSGDKSIFGYESYVRSRTYEYSLRCVRRIYGHSWYFVYKYY